MSKLDNQLEAARSVCGDGVWQPVADHIGDLGERIQSMSTSQQRTTDKPVTSNIRVPREVWDRLRQRAFDERVSVNALIVEAITEKLGRS